MNRRRWYAAAGYLAAFAALAAVIVTRHQAAPAEPVDPYYLDAGPAETAGVTAGPVAVTSTAPSITAPPSASPGPATTSEEARPVPAAPTAAPDETSAVAATATAFLHGWVLRADWDARNAALKGYTTPEYLAEIFPIDPDRVGLPAGTDIRADLVHVTVTDAGGATVPATVDGLAVVVHEVRTGAGWRVDSHEHG